MTKTINDAIVVRNLTKYYKTSRKPAIDNLSLNIKTGEIYGFLGPNGAGKTTAIRLLLNFLRPTSGSATILGKDSVNGSVAIKNHIGYLPGDIKLYPKMTGGQHIAYMSDLMAPKSQAYVNLLAKRLKADLNVETRNLSKGNKQKIGIILALMSQPKVLILDEPTSGLDPLMQEEFYSIIDDAKSSGCTVFISSHNLSEVQKLCDRVGIIREGKLVSEQAIGDLSTEAAQTYIIKFIGAAPLKQISKVDGVKQATSVGTNEIKLHLHGELTPLINFLAKYRVGGIAPCELDLEDAFMQLYEDKTKDKKS